MTHNDKQLFFEAKQSNLAYVDGINNKCTPILSFVLKKNPADPKLLYSIHTCFLVSLLADDDGPALPGGHLHRPAQ